MYIEERHQAILDIIFRKGSISTGEIQKKFGISYDSAKRDLRILEEKGLLRRTHGGAIPLSELTFNRAELSTEKQESAEAPAVEAAVSKALSLIKEISTVFIPGGRFGAALCRELVHSFSDERVPLSDKSVPPDCLLRVVTDSPECAVILSSCNRIKTVILGGRLSDGTVSDGFAVVMLTKLRFDLAFIEVPYFTEDFGISCNGGEEQTFLTALSDASRTVAAVFTEASGTGDAHVSVCSPEKVSVLLDIRSEK